MCRGRYKQIECRHLTDCNNHRRGECPFKHPDDNPKHIDELVDKVRRRIFLEMDKDGHALPTDHLLEVGIITQDEYDAIQKKKYDHEQLVEASKERQAERAKGTKGGKHGRSRSPPRTRENTPPPPNTKGQGKGQPKGSASPTPAETTETTPATTEARAGTDNRQRDHTTGREDQSDIEIIETPAPPPADNTEGQEDAQPGGNAEYNDGLPDFGTSPGPKGEEEETGETKTETDENMEQATKDEAEKEEPETPVANPDYVMVREATAEATADQSQSVIA